MEESGGETSQSRGLICAAPEQGIGQHTEGRHNDCAMVLGKEQLTVPEVILVRLIYVNSRALKMVLFNILSGTDGLLPNPEYF